MQVAFSPLHVSLKDLELEELIQTLIQWLLLFQGMIKSSVPDLGVPCILLESMIALKATF